MDGPALITGASSGFGREFARALAARGHDLRLVARRRERLEALADELVRTHGVAVEVRALDLGTDAGLAECRDWVTGVPVGVAVLNAGFGSIGPLEHADLEREREMVRVNCGAVADLAGAVLPGMRARGSGQLIITSSAAAFHPVPFMATYGATKAFDLHFARALGEELRGTGIGVLAVCPGPTRTEFSEILTLGGRRAAEWPSRMPVDDPRSVVAAALDAADRGHAVVSTGRIARLTRIATALLPTALTLRAVGAVHRARSRTAGKAGKVRGI
jgi:short-subunit dehydrogenase